MFPFCNTFAKLESIWFRADNSVRVGRFQKSFVGFSPTVKNLDYAISRNVLSIDSE